jgi:hypothetical protein
LSIVKEIKLNCNLLHRNFLRRFEECGLAANKPQKGKKAQRHKGILRQALDRQRHPSTRSGQAEGHRIRGLKK